MILSVAKNSVLDTAFDQIGLGTAAKEGGSVLIKINLAHPPEPLHPRTDPDLLLQVIQYIGRHGAHCTIAEGANGFLHQNIESIGFGEIVREYQVKLIDLDLENTDRLVIDNEEHYLPKCLRHYAVRLAVPATSKRPGMTFSNNIKLFVGAVPRRLYQNGDGDSPRPRVHADLHRSVASIYRSVMAYAPFHFFVNGGKAMFENRGETDLAETFVSDDGLELDQFLLDRFGIEPPDYIRRLAAISGVVKSC